MTESQPIFLHKRLDKDKRSKLISQTKIGKNPTKSLTQVSVIWERYDQTKCLVKQPIKTGKLEVQDMFQFQNIAEHVTPKKIQQKKKNIMKKHNLKWEIPTQNLIAPNRGSQ